MGMHKITLYVEIRDIFSGEPLDDKVVALMIKVFKGSSKARQANKIIAGLIADAWRDHCLADTALRNAIENLKKG